MKRDQRFPVVLSEEERAVLQRLADEERTPAAAVVRRLIWREADQRATEQLTEDELRVAQKLGLSPHDYWKYKGDSGGD